MTRLLPTRRLAAALRVALAVVTIGIAALAAGASSSRAPAGAAGTALPGGWELCILQGLNAPATQANVADLDEWQAAEGGSTNNTAAYNPFNTGRTTDVNGAPVPAVRSANGFPAFQNWLAGCTATVATLLQPNMWSITAALRAGDVAPPPAFLAAVDQSKWCAPSADGMPCYASTILGAASKLATGLLTGSSALTVYGNVQSDVHDYQQLVTKVLADQVVIVARTQQLASAQTAVSNAQNHLTAIERTLRGVAVDEYVSNGLYTGSSFVNPRNGPNPFGKPTADGVAAQQYAGIVAADVVNRLRAAASQVKAAIVHRDDAAHALSQADLTLVADGAAQNRALTRLVGAVAAIQKAGACTSVTIATPAASTSSPPTSATTPSSTTTTTTTSVPAPTSTTTVPTGGATPAPAARSTTSTSGPPTSVAPRSATTTTAAPSTTTSTTTTTVPAAGSTAAPAPANTPSANPAGLVALQGCMAALAPSGS